MNSNNKITHIERRAKPEAEKVVDLRAGSWVLGAGGWEWGVVGGGREASPLPTYFLTKARPTAGGP